MHRLRVKVSRFGEHPSIAMSTMLSIAAISRVMSEELVAQLRSREPPSERAQRYSPFLEISIYLVAARQLISC